MFDWLFGSKRQTNYDDTSSRYRDWQKANSAANEYYANNIANVDWNSLSDEDKASRTAEFDKLNNQRNALGENYQNMLDTYNAENQYYKNKAFGDGIIGSFLNPIAQTASAAANLAGGGYSKNNRDWVSDLGAAAETALNFVPGASALKSVNGATKLSKGALALNALTGAGASMADAYRQGGKNTDLNDAISQAGTGALFGAAVPAAIGLGGNFVKNRGGWRNMLPQSKLGKAALIGGGLYGGSKLLGGGGAIPQGQAQEQQPSDQDLYNYYMMTQGGYY